MHMISRDRDYSDFSQYNCCKNTLNSEFTLFLYQFHARKALFKVPKVCNIHFWHFSNNSSDLVAGSPPSQSAQMKFLPKEVEGYLTK